MNIFYILTPRFFCMHTKMQSSCFIQMFLKLKGCLNVEEKGPRQQNKEETK